MTSPQMTSAPSYISGGLSCETQEDLNSRSYLVLQMVQKDLEVALTYPAHQRLLLSKGTIRISTTEPAVSPWLHRE